MDLEAKPYAAIVETVLRLLLQYRVRAWTQGLQVYESEHTFQVGRTACAAPGRVAASRRTHLHE